MNLPKVSIIVPTYNVSEYLHECMESILNQTLREIEVIAVNDGSRDNSLEILQEYAKKDNRIKVISKPNSGYGHTMNVGIDHAIGEYIGIVEPDDWVQPDMYKTLYEKAKEENLDFIKADFYRFIGSRNEMKLFLNKLCPYPENYNIVVKPSEKLETFRYIMNTWSGIYRRKFIEINNIKHNETPGASFQDNGFWFQTFCLAERAMFFNKTFYMNRRDNPNSSVKNKEKVYALPNEYDFILNFLERINKKTTFYKTYLLVKYWNYIFNYNRIDEGFKLEFINKIKEDFVGQNEEDLSFLSKNEKNILRFICYSNHDFLSRYFKKIGIKEVNNIKNMKKRNC